MIICTLIPFLRFLLCVQNLEQNWSKIRNFPLGHNKQQCQKVVPTLKKEVLAFATKVQQLWTEEQTEIKVNPKKPSFSSTLTPFWHEPYYDNPSVFWQRWIRNFFPFFVKIMQVCQNLGTSMISQNVKILQVFSVG